MSRPMQITVVAGAVVLAAVSIAALQQPAPPPQTPPKAVTSGNFDTTINQNAQRLLEEGRKILSLRHVRLGGLLGRQAAAA